MRALALAGLMGFATMSPQQDGGMEGQSIEYRHGDVVLQGFAAWKSSKAERLPTVLIFPDWLGHGPYVQMRANQLAHMGYLAFAADMYGKGVYAKDHEEAKKLMGGVVGGGTKMMRERAAAALEAVKKHKMCDATRIAAMGYCFGGTTSLEMARAGLDLKGVASFHGNLATPVPGDAKNIKGKVIVFHGLDDGFVPEPVVNAFHAEMKKASVDYVFVGFAGAVHGFTIKDLGTDNSKGLAYNQNADRRSWTMLENFLKEVLQ